MPSIISAAGVSRFRRGRINEQVAAHPDDNIFRGNGDLMEAYPVDKVGEVGLTPLRRLPPDKALPAITRSERRISLIGGDDDGR